MIDYTAPSYMVLRIHTDGQHTRELRIPTSWNEDEQEWIGMITTPKSKKLICARGQDSMDLQNNFNRELKKHMEDKETGPEILTMFMPKEFWE